MFGDKVIESLVEFTKKKRKKKKKQQPLSFVLRWPLQGNKTIFLNSCFKKKNFKKNFQARQYDRKLEVYQNSYKNVPAKGSDKSCPSLLFILTLKSAQWQKNSLCNFGSSTSRKSVPLSRS